MFIFYDTETTGTHTAFDQILQFAAILTNADLKEVDRFEVRCRLNSHVIPAPGALRVTGMRVSQLIDPGLPSHYEMVRFIRSKLLSWSPAIFTGYNTMSFDEHLLRQALYQTLHPAYLTNTQGNGRADVLSLMHCLSLNLPDAINVPVGENGKRSLRLDKLAPANGFSGHHAHDALGDVEATIHLARIARDADPAAWDRFVLLSRKSAVLDFLADEPAFAATEVYFNKPYTFALATLPSGNSGSNSYAVNLSINLRDLFNLSDGDLRKAINRSPKPIRRLMTNAAPNLTPLRDMPPHVRNGLPEATFIEEQVRYLKANRALAERVVSLFEKEAKEFEASPHVELQIYDGFLDRADEATLASFHDAAWEGRFAIVESIRDPRARLLGKRLIYLERPDLLPEQDRRVIQRAIRDRLFPKDAAKTPWLNAQAAIAEATMMRSGATEDETSMLKEVEQYIATLSDRLSQSS